MAAAFNDYFKRFARHRAGCGLLVECNSAYNKYTLGGWYNMADFAADATLRSRMKMLLDLYWADWAIEQIDGVRGGSRHRCYPGRTSTEHSSADGLAWFHFDLGPALSKHPSTICGATSFYRPPACVVEMALDAAGRGTYAYVSRRPGLAARRDPDQAPLNFVADPSNPFFESLGVHALDPGCGGLLRYTWCTPDFVLGTSMVEARPREDWAGISSQNRWEGVIFAGHPTARIFFQPLAPRRGSVHNAYWSVQNKGVLVVQRLETSNAKGHRVWFDKSLARQEQGGWVFAEAPRAFAAVRVVQGRTAWEPDSVEQHREGKGRTDLGGWLACREVFSPVVLEVARRSDYPDFGAFQAAILANPLRWQDKRLEYRSSLYGTSLVLFADYSRPPEIDGRPVCYRASKVYDSPLVQSDFGSGVVRLGKGAQALTLDFNRP